MEIAYRGHHLHRHLIENSANNTDVAVLNICCESLILNVETERVPVNVDNTMPNIAFRLIILRDSYIARSSAVI